jgi:hypothetical protein
MHRWILLASLLSASALADTAYKWVDENGQVHYSDRPQEGAEEVYLPSAQDYGRSAPRTQAATPQPQSPANPPAVERPYELMEISVPTEQETLWNTGGTINVAVDMQPRLRVGHRLVVYLDGSRLDLNPPSASFVVPEVFRGTHSLQVAVVDAFDQEQVRTNPRRFMVQQTSALNPQRANPGRPAGN